MRVSETSIQAALMDAITERRARLGKHQQKIASGHKFQTRSDAPTDAAEAASLKRTQQTNTQWKANADVATAWTKVTTSRIHQTVDFTQRFHELAVQARNETLDSQSRKQIAEEMDGILESVVQIAESKHDGNYLFSGKFSQQNPISVTRSGGQITDVAQNPAITSWEQREIQLDQHTVENHGTLAGGSSGLFFDSSSNIFDTFIDIRDKLQSGTMPSDADMTRVEEALTRGTTQLVENGVDQRRFEQVTSRLQDVRAANKELLSGLEDTDMALAVTELSRLQASLQAAMKMGVQANSMSLANVI